MATLHHMLTHATHIAYQCDLLLGRTDLTTLQREYISAIGRNAARYQSIETSEADLVQRDGWHHTLRSPLAPIKGYVEILLMDAGGPLSLEQRRQLVTVRDHCDHMIGISDAMIDAAATMVK